ncbi:MAG: hypothetical protein LAT56_11270 [Wenzhouxiangella sp.]|nr:hypothetical protein [Wenzhouxiangella sp.]
MRKTTALTLDIKPSLLGQALVTILAGTALAVFFYVPPPLLVFVGAALAIGLLWAWRIAAFNKPRWRRVVVSTHGDQITLSGRGKQRIVGHFGGGLIDTGLLVGFKVKTEAGAHRVWLFVDNIEAENFVRLREQLRKHSEAG